MDNFTRENPGPNYKRWIGHNDELYRGMHAFCYMCDSEVSAQGGCRCPAPPMGEWTLCPRCKSKYMPKGDCCCGECVTITYPPGDPAVAETAKAIRAAIISGAADVIVPHTDVKTEFAFALSTLLHYMSLYPLEFNDAELRTVRGLAIRFNKAQTGEPTLGRLTSGPGD